MRLSLVQFAVIVIAGGSGGPVFAAAREPVLPHHQDIAPNAPYTPAQALQRMSVPPGFSVELVASEPEMVNPIAMAFDDRGRIWITESVEYPRRSAGPGRDQIKIVEGADRQGHATKVTCFTGGLNVPTGIAWGYGGVWALNSPDLLFFREKEGRAVSREVALTGFGRTDFHELPSSLTWGPDGWLYGLNGVFNQSRVIAPDGKRYDFTCAMWRFHPRTRQFQIFAQGTSNPYGIAWDSEGSAIIEACHWANDHLFHFVETGYYQRQAGPYPPFTLPIGSITDHSHQKTAYCGIAILDSDAFPAPYRGRVVVGNIHGGCLNVDQLDRDGATYLGKAAPDLMTAHDAWFMPVSEKIGPDGALYVLDWYDQYHCSQDAARDPAGVDRLRGRLYRLRYGPPRRLPPFDLANESDARLTSRLASGNIYFQETAQRILTERLSDPAAEKAPQRQLRRRRSLEQAALDPAAPRSARLHALWALIGGGALDPVFHRALLDNPDPAFRAWAVRAAGNLSKVWAPIRARVAEMARDPSPDVELQAAIAARKIEGCDSLAMLTDALAHCGQDKLIPAIVWPNLHPLLETNAQRLAALLRSDAADNSGAGRAAAKMPPGAALLMPRILDRLLSAANPDPAAIADLLEQTARRCPERAPECIAVISEKSAQLSPRVRSALKERLAPLIRDILRSSAPSARLSAELLAARLQLAAIDAAALARQFASDASPETARLQILDALIAFREKTLLAELPAALSNASPAFAAQIFARLGRWDYPRIADEVLAHYPKLAPALQPLAIDFLMQRQDWTRRLLDAVLANRIPRSALHANHLRQILESDDREAIWAVEKTFGHVRADRNPARERVVAEMGAYLRNHPGDPFAGERIFRNFCAQCHTIYGAGGKVGPDLTSSGRGSFDQVVTSVFDPSLVIGAGYQTVTVVTKEGRSLTGLLREDNPQQVVVTLPGAGQETVPRNDVKYVHVSKLSMMPEGIETLFSKKDLSDLFAFLSLDKPPADSSAKLIPGAPPLRSERQGPPPP